MGCRDKALIVDCEESRMTKRGSDVMTVVEDDRDATALTNRGVAKLCAKNVEL